MKKDLKTNLMTMKTLSVLLFVLAMLFCTISNAQWQPDVQLTNNSGASFTSDNNAWCVAADGNLVHVVWYDDRDGNFEIYYKRSTDAGASWGADTRLSSDTARSFEPSIAVSGSIVHVVWYDYRNGDYADIYYKRSTDGGVSWGADMRLTNGSAESKFPSVSVSGLNVHVVWIRQDTSNLITNTYYKRSTDGGANWDANRQLTFGNLAYMVSPSISVSGQSVHVTMTDINAQSAWNIYYVRSTDGGANWGAGTWLTDSTVHSWWNCIAASGLLVHVVWFSERDGHYEIFYKRSMNGGVSWESNTRLTNNNFPSEYPSVAASGLLVHIVWVSVGSLYYIRSEDGGASWGAASQISYVNQHPSIAVSATDLHVVWTFSTGNFEIFYKRNPTGNIGITAISSEIPSSFTLYQNYPNPFNPITKIRFDVPAERNGRDLSLQLVIYDMLGREIVTLVNESLKPGTYEVDWDGTNYPSGVYFYKLTANNFNQTGKMMLIK